ncbi:ABC transporter permease [Marinagarivorans cellulosilyticus]|uniref:ABC transport system permease protein n=1 Tax=Marinagarivorans cellulosilyticus TaxID=2721545 RepID=A0AAN2BIW7_9GAMM|nr:ABC transporter permease [Marinagarivorans cellulosilyticus]BCD96405.1 putative ABC transport system permease protein [Marinagarivorans cellulosilyticus]
MLDLDRWQEIAHTLGRHKLRTTLTAFGVFWGIFMLVLLLGAGNSLKQDALSRFGASTNTIYLWAGRPTQLPYQGFAKGRRVGLNISDRDYLRQNLHGAELVLEQNQLGGWQADQYIVRNGKSGSYQTTGAHAETALLEGFVAIKGRFLNVLDYTERRKVAVIGDEVYSDLFDKDEDPIGQSLEIGGLYFKIVGVFAPSIPSENTRRDSQSIRIPNSTLRHAFNQLGWIGSMRIKPKEGVSAIALEQQALSLLKELHHIHPDEKAAIGHYNSEKDYLKVMSLFTGLQAFSWFVAIGTLLAGVIGVGNIMLIVVKERTREIGLRKALGATRWSVLSLIIQEALVITTLAGYTGLVAGVAMLELFSSIIEAGGIPGFGVPSIDFSTALSALAILVFSGLLAAWLPARKAAAVNPITALQDD